MSVNVKPRDFFLSWRLLLLGGATGALSGLLGIGGGVVMVPALVAMGQSRHRANANSLATIFLIAPAGTFGFAISGAVDWPAGIALGAGGLIGATLGARWAHRVSGQTLARLFGVLLLVVGFRMLIGDAAGSGSIAVDLPWNLVMAAAVGVASGALSGMAGVGGGIVMVPAAIFFLGLSQHVAEGTSLLAILFTAAAGTRVNHSNGYVDWRVIVTLAATGIVAAPLAAFLAQEIPAQTLAQLFAVWVLFIGVRTLWLSRAVSKQS